MAILMPKISVITVSYNSAKTISETLHSVASQIYQNVEHLIIDGQSEDETMMIVHANRHDRLIVHSEPDSGIYDAMNKGIARASGDIVGFLNSDDQFADLSVLTRVAAVFQSENVDACYGDLVYVTQDNRRVLRYWKSNPYIKEAFGKGWCPAHPTFYVRKDSLNRSGCFDLSFKLAADAEFMMRYLGYPGMQSVYIPHVFVRMRVGGQTNKSWSNIFLQNREIFRALRKNNINYNAIDFILRKIVSRLLQYLKARLPIVGPA